MSDKIYLGSRLVDLDIGEPSNPVSKVILNVDSETCFVSGDDTGLTIEQDCPWATQAMADSVLAKLQGFVYKPYSGTDALLDPAAELGDAVTVGGTYGILAQMGRTLDHLCAASVAAPGTDEIEDEYPYKSKQRKQTDRELARAYSRISKTSEKIRLEINGLEEKQASMTLTLDGFQTQINGKIDGNEAQTLIDQSIDQISLSVSSANGSTTFTLKDGETTLDTQTLNLTVEAVNITGTLNANQINMTGAISWGDLSSGVQGEISDAQNTADTALELAESISLPDYIQSTYIDSTTILSPLIKGNNIQVYGTFQATDADGYVTGYMGAANGQSGDGTTTYGVALSNTWNRSTYAVGTNYLIVTDGGVRMQAGNSSVGVVNNNVLIQSADGDVWLSVDSQKVKAAGGAFVVDSNTFGYSLPTTDLVTGRIFFLLES